MESKTATPIDLVDAPRNALARKRQEDAWGQTEVNVRQQLHAREAAITHKDRVLESIRYHDICLLLLGALSNSHSILSKLNIDTLSHVAGYWFHGRQSRLLRAVARRKRRVLPPPASPSAPFRLFLRQRPLLPFEKMNDEYSVINSAREGRALIAHKGMLCRTGKRLNVSHMEYSFDHVFDGTASQDEVTNTCLEPLLDYSLLEGGESTLLLFGQTGTGKTYTQIGRAHV